MLRRLACLTALTIALLGLPATATAIDVDAPGEIDTIASTVFASGGGLYGSDLDDQGNLYVADLPSNKVWKVEPDGTASVFAGTGTAGYDGDGGLATGAKLDSPYDVDWYDGNLYIADRDNHVIRVVDSAGNIDTFAGTGTSGYSGDDGPATSAQLALPKAVSVDASGNVYIGEDGNNTVRKVTTEGTISTLASSLYVWHLDADAAGNVYVADFDLNKVWKVSSGGTVTLFAGDGVNAYDGDGGAATDASLPRPNAVAVDADGTVYISTSGDSRIRQVTAGVITTAVGDGTSGYTGDGGPATAARISTATGLATDPVGNLFITDYYNAIRVVAYADTDGDGFPDLVDNFPDTYSRCRNSQATIIGTGGADNPLNGTEGPDVIMGFGGADVIYGYGGDDLICAGNGADTVYGGDGKDKIYGQNGPDTIYGNEKSDRLYGGDNDDVIRGNGGTRDRLFGGSGTDDLNGGTGTDDRCTLGETYANCEVIF